METETVEDLDIEKLYHDDMACTARHKFIADAYGVLPEPCSVTVTYWRTGCRLNGPICENAAQQNFRIIALGEVSFVACNECRRPFSVCCVMTPL